MKDDTQKENEKNNQSSPLTHTQKAPLIPLIPATSSRSLLVQRILRSASKLFLFLLDLLSRLKALGGVRVAEAMHVHGFDGDAWAAVATVGGADIVSCVFLAVAPFVESEVLAAHCESSDLSCEIFDWRGVLSSGSNVASEIGLLQMGVVRFEVRSNLRLKIEVDFQASAVVGDQDVVVPIYPDFGKPGRSKSEEPDEDCQPGQNCNKRNPRPAEKEKEMKN